MSDYDEPNVPEDLPGAIKRIRQLNAQVEALVNENAKLRARLVEALDLFDGSLCMCNQDPCRVSEFVRKIRKEIGE